VLVNDDTWTSGARPQSAASALERVGARVVAIVPVARYFQVEQRDQWDSEWWKDQRRIPFRFESCALCTL
jgi:hypothetical protein